MEIQHYQTPLLVEDMQKLMEITGEEYQKDALAGAVKFTLKSDKRTVRKVLRE